MDYTKQELRPLIYKDRQSIDDFDINNPKSLDALMLSKIEDSMIIELEGASRYILEIFNNAHYITTLILMEPHPVHYLRNYLTIAEHAGSAYQDVKETNTYFRYFESITMAMVWNYLSVCLPEKYYLGNDDKLLKGIWDYHIKQFNDYQWDGKARFLFFNNVMKADEIKKYHMNHKFVPLHSPDQLETMMEGTIQPEETSDKKKIANLENLIKSKDKTIKNLKKELAEEKAKPKELTGEEQEATMQLELESHPVLKLLWYLMKLDGAKSEGQGRKKAAQNIMSTLSKIPYNTTKKFWGHEDDVDKRQENLLIEMNHWMKTIGMKFQF